MTASRRKNTNSRSGKRKPSRSSQAVSPNSSKLGVGEYYLPKTGEIHCDPITWQARILFFDVLRTVAPQVLIDLRESVFPEYKVVWDDAIRQLAKDLSQRVGGLGNLSYMSAYNVLISRPNPYALAAQDWNYTSGRLRTLLEEWGGRWRIDAPPCLQAALSILNYWATHPEELASTGVLTSEMEKVFELRRQQSAEGQAREIALTIPNALTPNIPAWNPTLETWAAFEHGAATAIQDLRVASERLLEELGYRRVPTRPALRDDLKRYIEFQVLQLSQDEVRKRHLAESNLGASSLQDREQGRRYIRDAISRASETTGFPVREALPAGAKPKTKTTP